MSVLFVIGSLAVIAFDHWKNGDTVRYYFTIVALQRNSPFHPRFPRPASSTPCGPAALHRRGLTEVRLAEHPVLEKALSHFDDLEPKPT
jgi:hypothetical protein